MIKSLVTVGAFALGMMSASSGVASTAFTCEGGGPGNGAPGFSPCVGNDFNDFSDAVSDPSFVVTGDYDFYGGVTTGFTDGWTVDFQGGAYKVDLFYNEAKNPFTGSFAYSDGVFTNTVLLDDSGTVDLGNLAGEYTFAITPTTKSTFWNLSIKATTDGSIDVPLPASGLLLLAAFGAAGFVSRRRNS